MNAQPTALSAHVLAHLLADHQWLEGILEQLYAAWEINDNARSQKLRADLEWDLSAHLNAEEHFVIPTLSDEHDALVILGGHRRLRACLADLRAGGDSKCVSIAAVCRMIDELRAHSRQIERLFYQSSDELADESHPVLAATLAA